MVPRNRRHTIVLLQERISLMRSKEIYLSALVCTSLIFGLYLTHLYSYLLFHSLVELFSIIIAVCIFLIAWNARHFMGNGYLLFLGISYLFIGNLDLLHTLSYKGMGIFHDYNTNLTTQLWIASRYMEGLTLLIAPVYLDRRLPARIVFFSYTLVTSLVLWAIFSWNIFPACYIDGTGLTPFKKTSEYIISLILALSIVVLLQKRRELDRSFLRLIVGSILLTIGSEMSFTLYIDVYGFYNLLGHFFKFISFYFIYKAIIGAGLSNPFSILLRDLKESEQALKREHDFTSAILSTAGALVVVFDRKGQVVRFNRTCEDLSGYSFDDVKGKPIWDIILIPDEKHTAMKTFEQLASGKFPNRYENHLVTRKRKRHLIMWSNTALTGSDGSIEYIISTGIDITQLRKAEKALRESEERYRRLVELSFDGIAIHANGRIVFINATGAELLGAISPQQILGKRVLDFVHPDYRANAEEQHRQILEEGKPIRLTEEKLLGVSGLSIDVEIVGIPITYNNGHAMQIVFRDITGRKKAEEQILRAKQEWENTFDAVPDAISIIDDQHRIIRGNKAMADRLGCTPKDLVGCTCYEVFHGTQIPPDCCPHTFSLQDGSMHSEEVTGRHSEEHFLVTVSPIHDHNDKIVGSVHVARNITERKKAEESLKKAHDHLEIRVNERTAELAQISRQLLNVQEDERKRIARELHDSIGQSLADAKLGLENSLELIKGGEFDKSVESMEAIISRIQQLSDEVRRIHTELRPPLLDDLGIILTISWFCREFGKLHPAILVEKEIALEEHDVPDDIKIVVFRVLQEAFNNIAKHSKSKSARLALTKTDGSIEFLIEDFGEGFHAHEVGSENLLHEGFGLTNMKERTELSGGNFSIESQKGKGTVIRSSWPRERSI